MDLSKAKDALERSALSALIEELESLFPNEAAAGTVREFVEFAAGDAPIPSSADPARQLFLNCLYDTRRILSGAPLPALNHLKIGPELDFLCDQNGVEGWTFEQSLNYLWLGRIRPSRKSVVVTAMRDDGIYILEWVAHYRAVGFDHIIVYTNENSDGSEELLRLLAEHSVITLVESEVSGTVPPESKGFGHALHLLHDFRDFEWALFVDSDEYFVPGPCFDGSIASLLSAFERRFPNEAPSGICFDWLWFISGMTFKRTSHILLERFQHARHHHLTKCMARIQDLVSMRRDHYAEVKTGGYLVDSVFEPVDMASIYDKTPQYRGGRVNHYWPRSFQEFAVKKARGASMNMTVNLYDRPFSKFFSWNGYEAPDNHFPPDPEFVGQVKLQMDWLRSLDGVKTAAALLDLNFPYLVHLIADEAQLRRIYNNSMVEPSSL